LNSYQPDLKYAFASKYFTRAPMRCWNEHVFMLTIRFPAKTCLQIGSLDILETSCVNWVTIFSDWFLWFLDSDGTTVQTAEIIAKQIFSWNVFVSSTPIHLPSHTRSHSGPKYGVIRTVPRVSLAGGPDQKLDQF